MASRQKKRRGFNRLRVEETTLWRHDILFAKGQSAQVFVDSYQVSWASEDVLFKARMEDAACRLRQEELMRKQAVRRKRRRMRKARGRK